MIWTNEMRNLLVSRAQEGISWKDIRDEMFNTFGYYVSVDSIRRHYRRLTAIPEIDSLNVEKLELGTEKLNLIQRQNTRLLNENAKLHAIQNLIIETIQSSVVKLPEIYPPKEHIKKVKYKQETSVLELSDIQIGSAVRPEVTGGLCRYNSDIMKKRLGRLTQSVLEIIDIQRGGGIPIDRLNIHLLGDIVQGDNIYRGQGFELEVTLLDQVFTLADSVVDIVFLPLLKAFPKVEFFCVPGNHGRNRDVARTTNWDYVVYWLWKQRLSATKHARFYISAAPFLLYELYPHQIHALIHGNQARGWMGYPYYGIDRLHKNLTSLTGTYISYLHHGHHHQPSLQDTHIGKKIGNGSIEGGSEYSVCDLSTSNVPQQFFFGINEKGMTWEYWLRLEDYPHLKPNANGILTTLAFE